MNKVDRFWSHEAQNIRCVRESDYDALAAELAEVKGGDETVDMAGKIAVSSEPLRQLLQALINAPHEIRELQATRDPVELFGDNPINVLVAEFNAAIDTAEEK